MKLSKIKQELLDEAYNIVIQVCLFDRPLEELAPLLAEDVMNFGDWIYEIVALAAAVAACVGFYAGYFAKKAWGRWLMYYSGVATLVLPTIFYLIYMV